MVNYCKISCQLTLYAFLTIYFYGCHKAISPPNQTYEQFKAKEEICKKEISTLQDTIKKDSLEYKSVLSNIDKNAKEISKLLENQK